MLVATEDQLIQAVKDLFGPTLKTVDSLPGDWDADMLKRLIISAPAVYIAFLGGPRDRANTAVVGIEARWSFFAITAHASGEAARRRGDSRQIGAYEIIERLVPKMDGYTIDGVGTLDLDRVENLYSGTIDNRGVSLYAALFSVPMYFDNAPPLATLDAFETLHVDFDLAQKDGTIEGSTDIDLPQP